MNQVASISTGTSNAGDIRAAFDAQLRAQLVRRADFDRKARVAQLDRLAAAIKRNQDKIIAACAADFRKPAEEVKLTEIFPVLQEIRHTKHYLKSWMRPKRAVVIVFFLKGITFPITSTFNSKVIIGFFS